MVVVTRSLVSLGVIGLVVGVGCGESSSNDDGPAGGKSPGATGGAGGVGTGGKSGGAGGSSAVAGRGGNASGGGGGSGGSAAGAGRVGRGGNASSGGSAGAAAGRGSGATGGDAGSTGATGGTGGSDGEAGAGAGAPANGWDAACNGVTPNGRCDGDVYEWCDYFTRSLKSLDCAGLGMTCHADATQPPETDLNGCVGDPCTVDDEHCDVGLKYECILGALHVVDCAQSGGEEAVCEATSGSARCLLREPCDAPSTLRCDGDLFVICNEDGYLYFEDCARCNPEGTCVEGAGQATCMPGFLDCSS